MGRNNNDFELQKPLHKRADTTLFDLDGTLAMTDDPKAQHKINHPKFAAKAKEAAVNKDMREKVRDAAKDGNVVIMTARSAHYRDITKKWLHENDIPYDALIMRPTDNVTSDKKVKRELLEEDVLPKFDVEKAYDDKSKNRKMFKKLGIETKGVK